MNQAFNFKAARETNTVSITDVMTRCFDNAERMLPAPDAPPPRPPAKPISLDYPHISTQPEYAAEAEKLNRFCAERDAAIAKLEQLREQANADAQMAQVGEVDAISNAEALLAGEVQQNLQAEIDQTTKLIEALRKAMEAQHLVMRRVAQGLSAAAGRRYAQEHKERVKRMMTAVVELHAANQAEIDLHYDLSRLGYTEDPLPAMRLNTVEDPNDTNGNMAYYWYREAMQYSKTEAEIAAGVRKSRMAAALD